MIIKNGLSGTLMVAFTLGLLALPMASCQKKSESVQVIDESKPHAYYTCSMHTDVHIHEAGKTCPICNMDLTLIEQESKNRAPPDMDIGRATVNISPQKQQLIGVRLGKVKRDKTRKVLRTYGRVAYDPELYHAQEEFISALEIAAFSPDDPENLSRKRSDRLVKAARTRLQILGLGNDQIKELEQERKVDLKLLLGPMESGKVWVYADIYESDLSVVRKGQKVKVIAPSYPGKTFWGKVVAIDSVINPKTRTARIRSKINDPGKLLKPDLYVNVYVHASLGSRLVVPASSVLDSGDHQYVFVHTGEGTFEPRKVKLGRKVDGFYEILENLKENEEIVVSGNFLIDSESQLRSGMSGMAYYGGKEAAE